MFTYHFSTYSHEEHYELFLESERDLSQEEFNAILVEALKVAHARLERKFEEEILPALDDDEPAYLRRHHWNMHDLVHELGTHPEILEAYELRVIRPHRSAIAQGWAPQFSPRENYETDITRNVLDAITGKDGDV